MDKQFHAAISSRTEILVAIVVISCTVVAMLFIWVTRRRARNRRLLLPSGPRGWPLIGSILQLGTFPYRSLHALSFKYGPLMYLYLGSVPTLVVSNADMAKQVLKIHDRNMASRPEFTVPTYLSYGRKGIAFAPYGTHWRELRKICTLRLLTTSRIQYFKGKREGEVLAMLRSILEESEQGKSMQIAQFLANMTMNIMTQMMWNKRHSGLHERSKFANDRDQSIEYLNMIREFFDLSGSTNIADFVPVLKPLAMNLQGFKKRMKAAHERMDIFLGDIITEHQNSLQKRSLDDADSDDFVDVLLKISKENGFEEALSTDTIKATLQDMVLAGTDTTATTLEWALAELLRCPSVMRKAQQELDSVVGKDKLVTEDDIPALTYLQAVVKETLRLRGPAPISVPHLSTEHSTIAGFHVPAGTLVLLNFYAIHRDPATWERPLAFDPERFLNSSSTTGFNRSPIDFKGQNFELLPFGSGRRMCPGINLANSVLHFALAQLLHAFTWTLAGDGKPEDQDMTEVYGLVSTKAHPLSVSAQLRIRNDVLHPVAK